MANATVRLRDLVTGDLVGAPASTNAAGQFSFVSLNPSTYAVEVVSAGEVVGTSGPIIVGPGAAVTSVSVTASVAVEQAVLTGGGGIGGGIGGGVAGAGAGVGAGAAGTGMAGVVGAAAAAAGVAGAAYTNGIASPSQ